MKTSVIEVRDMLSVLSVLGVEEKIGAVPGVESVTVNYAGGSATVRYDETRLNIADIKSDVRQREHESAPGGKSASGGHEGHPTPGATPAAPKPAPDAVAASAMPASDGQRDNVAQGAAASTKMPAAPKPVPPATPVSDAPKPAPNAAASVPASVDPEADKKNDQGAAGKN